MAMGSISTGSVSVGFTLFSTKSIGLDVSTFTGSFVDISTAISVDRKTELNY